MEEKKNTQITTLDGVNVIAGIWLVISPFVLGFVSQTALVNNVILGLAVGIFALIRAATQRAAWLDWINVVLGVWLIISPFALGFLDSTGALWNNVVLGVIVIVFAGWSSGVPSKTHRMTTA